MKKMVAVLLMATTLAGCYQVDTGNVGVESTFGQYKETALPAGVYFALFKTVREVNAKEVSVDLLDMRPKAKDNVTLTDVDVTVYYQIQPDMAAKILTRYASDFVYDKQGDMVLGTNLIGRLAREATYNAITKYNASDMHTKRSEIAADIEKNLKAELTKDAGGMFHVKNIIIRNIVTDPRLEDAIKQAAEVEFSIRRKFQELELAKTEAERKKIEAEGEAVANKIISESLTSPLIELRRIEAMSNFAKEGTHTIVLPQNTTPLINVK